MMDGWNEVGMDVAEVRAMASKMNAVAGDLQGVIHSLDDKIANASWVGEDRDRFLKEWQTRHYRALQDIVNGLQNAARVAADQARDQDRISGT